MTRLKCILLGIALSIILGDIHSQVLSVLPVFPKETDTITVIFDATQGNAALKGASQVYAHAGVITSLSTSGSDWKHVVGTWGTADSRVKMTALGNDRWSLRYQMKNFYAQAGAFQSGETIKQLAFVFRNQDGSIVGRTSAGGDIFSPVYSASSQLLLKITVPENKTTVGTSTDVFHIEAWTSKACDFKATIDGTTFRNLSATDSIQINKTGFTQGNHKIVISGSLNSEFVSDSVYFVVNPSVVSKYIPAGIEQGITYVNDSTVYLALYAPGKSNVYAIGDFSNWQPNVNYFMNYDPSKAVWWIKISGLIPGKEVGYQYLVDGKLRIADPFSPIMLNEWDDGGIPSANYPNLKPYPKNLTSNWVTVMQPGASAYTWKNTSFKKPKNEKLLIYECLVRDFTKAQTFKALKDSIPYLKRLGFTALELMPVTEFEGNNSWGYNVASHMAIDKMYGTRNDLKSLIDECHANGIAVLFDVVFNHAFNTASICQLYWDDVNSRPSASSPYANPIATHPFNVGNDLNHESYATKYYVKYILKYLLTEFHVDGFRFDLSKGFTQKNSGSDANLMAQYDASRIAILSDYHDLIKSVDSTAIHILEHFADNSEEQELCKRGMLLWGNANYNMLEASMGFVSTSDFGWGIDYSKRSFSAPNLVGYICSHDEERVAYKTINFGNSASGYSTRSNPIFLQRSGLVHSFLLLTPGPKMIWQFDEVGYDYSINYCTNGTINNSCRLDPKPVRWDYWTGSNPRKKLYYIQAGLANLKINNFDVSNPKTFSLTSAGAMKKLQLNGNSMTAVLIGNTDVSVQSSTTVFPSVGWWYDYMTGDSLQVKSVSQNLTLNPGDFRVYLNKKIANPFASQLYTLNLEESENKFGNIKLFPNPSNGTIRVQMRLESSKCTLKVFNLQGALMMQMPVVSEQTIDVSSLNKGLFFYQFETESGQVLPGGKLILE